MRAANISREIGKLGLMKSKEYQGRITGMSTEGYKVFTAWNGDIEIKYTPRTSSFNGWQDERFINRMTAAANKEEAA